MVSMENMVNRCDIQFSHENQMIYALKIKFRDLDYSSYKGFWYIL